MKILVGIVICLVSLICVSASEAESEGEPSKTYTIDLPVTYPYMGAKPKKSVDTVVNFLLLNNGGSNSSGNDSGNASTEQEEERKNQVAKLKEFRRSGRRIQESADSNSTQFDESGNDSGNASTEQEEERKNRVAKLKEFRRSGRRIQDSGDSNSTQFDGSEGAGGGDKTIGSGSGEDATGDSDINQETSPGHPRKKHKSKKREKCKGFQECIESIRKKKREKAAQKNTTDTPSDYFDMNLEESKQEERKKEEAKPSPKKRKMSGRTLSGSPGEFENEAQGEGQASGGSEGHVKGEFQKLEGAKSTLETGPGPSMAKGTLAFGPWTDMQAEEKKLGNERQIASVGTEKIDPYRKYRSLLGNKNDGPGKPNKEMAKQLNRILNIQLTYEQDKKREVTNTIDVVDSADKKER